MLFVNLRQSQSLLHLIQESRRQFVPDDLSLNYKILKELHGDKWINKSTSKLQESFLKESTATGTSSKR